MFAYRSVQWLERQGFDSICSVAWVQVESQPHVRIINLCPALVKCCDAVCLVILSDTFMFNELEDGPT